MEENDNQNEKKRKKSMSPKRKAGIFMGILAVIAVIFGIPHKDD